ncbi:hypothetical protein [Actinomadura chokoriensis]|uniref:Serine protease n=1 Tax=Actinomadura chokoriensis TaxID=454156 RepID=A0ABV4QZ84_9ACTN
MDAFEPSPEQNLTLSRVRLCVPPGDSGGPLLNEHGEVAARSPTQARQR